MRTTINLDPDVEAEVEKLRRAEGLGLSEAVNTLARRGLVRERGENPYRFSPRPLEAKIDLTNIGDVLAQLDDAG